MSDERELLIVRRLDAAPELVFDAWTQAEHIARWWGPKDFTAPHQQVDARAGGAYRVCIRSPEGVDYWISGVFREFERPTRLVFTWAWEDDDGKPGHETEVTVQMEAVNGGTRMTFRQAVFESVAERDSHEGGWTECLDKLAAYVRRAATEVAP